MKNNFPIFTKNPELRYFDSAATALKPQVLVDSISNFYSYENAPVHRAGYLLAGNASEKYENARKTIANYLGVSEKKIAFTSGATDAINKVAIAYSQKKLNGILISETEHHSNFLPWMNLARTKKCDFFIAPYNSKTFYDFEFIEEKLKTKKINLIAISAMSNVLGQTGDLKKLVDLAHKYGAKILLDGAQHICHSAEINLEKLGCDFYVFSGHKLYAPTGIGVLYIKNPEDLEPPFLGGGMIENVEKNNYTTADFPKSWEAGTPFSAQAIGLAEVMKWLEKNNFAQLILEEEKLVKMLKKGLKKLGAKILGTAEKSLVSCSFEGVNSNDLGTMLGMKNICVRAGKHCAHPLHCALNFSKPTLRFSLGIYNTKEDIEVALKETKNTLEKLK
ncbi:MAG: aminotransferase class V-fold PLP-dependent enzyme [Alphaproteobacteria bacterium]|nr:MAG: hypothetical protein B6I23_01945 [Rickettsiaceae bacterium 4572_127]